MTNPWLLALATFVLCSIWQIPFLAFASSISSRLLRRLGPAAEHKLCVATYLLAILLPFCSALPFFLHSAPRNSTARLLVDHTTSSSAGDSTRFLLHLPASLLASIAILYLAFLLLRLLRFTMSLSGTLGMLREARDLPLSPAAAAIWADCRQLSPSLSNTRLLHSEHIPGPVTLGLRHPSILLPPDFIDRLTPADVRAALAHEAAHIKRHDFAKNLVYEALGCLIAFHPAAWLLQARLAETREMVCDADAARCLPTHSVYVQSLLRLATLVAMYPPCSPPHAIGIFGANILEKRIMILKTLEQPVSKARSSASILLASACLCTAFSAAVIAAPWLTPSVRASSTSSQDHVYSIGGDVKAPVLISQKEPEFPASGRNLKAPFSGSCILGFTVDRSGTPKNVHVLHSLNQSFDGKAIEAVRQYRFKPAELAGKPVASAVKVEVNFQKF